MEIFIFIVATLIIWILLVFMLFATISFVRYAYQEIIHSFNNAKRFVKETLVDIEWAWKHRR